MAGTRTTFPPLIGVHFLRAMVVVRLRGDLSGTPHADAESLGLCLAATSAPVVVNVAAVTGMNTDGLRWMMRMTQEARRQGQSLILESPTPCVEEVLALTGCHTWFSATWFSVTNRQTDHRSIDPVSMVDRVRSPDCS